MRKCKNNNLVAKIINETIILRSGKYSLKKLQREDQQIQKLVFIL